MANRDKPRYRHTSGGHDEQPPPYQRLCAIPNEPPFQLSLTEDELEKLNEGYFIVVRVPDMQIEIYPPGVNPLGD